MPPKARTVTGGGKKNEKDGSGERNISATAPDPRAPSGGEYSEVRTPFGAADFHHLQIVFNLTLICEAENKAACRLVLQQVSGESLIVASAAI
jgi:hypothetical protein